MVAIARIAAAAEVDPSYLPAGANVHYVVALSHTSLPPPKGISVVFFRFCYSHMAESPSVFC